MAKRGESGLSLIVGVNKPLGISSHDVVNRCRRIFGEKRVGHAGTLDPQASGVLLVCIGPATRLNDYLLGHDKSYRFTVNFGARTATDDTEGEVVETGAVSEGILDPAFACSYVDGLVGTHDQMPPLYSAIKMDGKKAYEQARKGNSVSLSPRTIQIHSAKFLSLGDNGSEGYPAWEIEVHVSKGTYIRSLARDIGEALGCPAHVGRLERTELGSITLADCVTLEELEQRGITAALDPIAVLGVPYLTIADEKLASVRNGRAFQQEELEESTFTSGQCTLYLSNREQVENSLSGLEQGMVAFASEERLEALYEFSDKQGVLKPRCVLSTGVLRGNYT